MKRRKMYNKRKKSWSFVKVCHQSRMNR